MRPTELIPQPLHDELLRLGRLDPHWVQIHDLKDGSYEATARQDTWSRKIWAAGQDAFALLAASRWLADGPKIFRATEEQCRALEQVDVNLTLTDYSQPYPALLVELPKGLYSPFHSVLCFKDGTFLSCSLFSDGNLNDIVTTVRQTAEPVETSLRKFDEDCRDLADKAAPALRVACNSCLALSHYGNRLDYLFPKEVERDKALSKEWSDRGAKALARIPLAVQVVTFDQEIKLHRVERGPTAEPGSPTGRHMPPHWRRGHWAMVPCGAGRIERRRVLRRPTLVRADLFVGDKSQTQTTYV